MPTPSIAVALRWILYSRAVFLGTTGHQKQGVLKKKYLRHRDDFLNSTDNVIKLDFTSGIYGERDCALQYRYMPFLAMKATVCMTNVIAEPSPIFYTSWKAGVMKLGSHSNQLRI